MLAARYRSNGAAREVLELATLPDPVPGPGEVRVKVAYSGVNPSDVKSRAGSRPVEQGYVVPHSDGAGEIDAVGQGVDPARLGQRVWLWNAQYGRRDGTAAQYVCLPAGQAVPLPEGVSLQAGAALGIPALTAVHALRLAALSPGEPVLVTGAASNVGFYAAQLARLAGAEVIGTVGAEDKAQSLRALGLQRLIDYKREPVAERVRAWTGGRGAHALIDLDFSRSARLVREGALADHARFVCYGSNDRGDIPIHFASWLPRAISLHFFLVYTLTPQARQAAIAELQARLPELRHHAVEIYPLADIVAAHERVESGRFAGKVLVAP
ncbi:NADPH:quinone reductase [Bordetella hinzii]|uniref:NADPH:quinone reductase n=2 Tax=Bordetella hinzii TaxID=103855 RepID=A0AAN1RZ89_9BORD|nr:NADPH:quinone reductase [Bordetella hinzii]AKQ60201.1 Phthiocerol synthesis polyketide synthase type I PpsC [Bordetella hinzii]AZW18723.1 NADPH:quinone reductase [Bordetella hinzii]KCB24591.1 oxidoreductase, zinc-binding dehydrogenase family protein [Bordetella hinzii OH87 BAL007II]KCB34472.1 oxidoreductase, zinc-binding dehydrogenase family protein [Bordetella hinzii CA90 BAL1384]KCB39264.1 oxidoreductase, zinc-binding dehydrogenase family protein [Bordetella hinzii 5132]